MKDRRSGLDRRSTGKIAVDDWLFRVLVCGRAGGGRCTCDGAWAMRLKKARVDGSAISEFTTELFFVYSTQLELQSTFCLCHALIRGPIYRTCDQLPPLSMSYQIDRRESNDWNFN